MKQLSMLLNWKNMAVMGLAVLAGGTVTAYEMNAAIDRADAASRTRSANRTDAVAETVDESKAQRVTALRRENVKDAQATAATEIARCCAALLKTH